MIGIWWLLLGHPRLRGGIAALVCCQLVVASRPIGQPLLRACVEWPIVGVGWIVVVSVEATCLLLLSSVAFSGRRLSFVADSLSNSLSNSLSIAPYLARGCGSHHHCTRGRPRVSVSQKRNMRSVCVLVWSRVQFGSSSVRWRAWFSFRLHFHALHPSPRSPRLCDT